MQGIPFANSPRNGSCIFLTKKKNSDRRAVALIRFFPIWTRWWSFKQVGERYLRLMYATKVRSHGDCSSHSNHVQHLYPNLQHPCPYSISSTPAQGNSRNSQCIRQHPCRVWYINQYTTYLITIKIYRLSLPTVNCIIEAHIPSRPHPLSHPNPLLNRHPLLLWNGRVLKSTPTLITAITSIE